MLEGLRVAPSFRGDGKRDDGRKCNADGYGEFHFTLLNGLIEADRLQSKRFGKRCRAALKREIAPAFEDHCS